MWQWCEKSLLKLIRTGSVPKHIAFIMDGNRRWASKSGMKKHQGHSFGLEKLLEVISWCLDLGIGIISVYAFSTDNFNRSTEEVAELMGLFEKACQRLADKESSVISRGVQVRIIGDISKFPEGAQKALRKLESDTERNNTCLLNICLGYGGIEETIAAMESVREKVKKGIISHNEITQEVFENELWIKEPVDLMVRTGETRLSNFMVYQSSTRTKFKLIKDILWPDLKVWHLAYIIFSYQFLL